MEYRAKYDRTIYYNPANRYSIISLKSGDRNIPEKAREKGRFRDHLIRFTAVGFELPRTDAVELALTGEWTEGKYGTQLKVEGWREIVPQTTEGIRGYLASGLLKGIGEKTADAIVGRFGLETMEILEHRPEELLEIRGITAEKLEDIKRTYQESRMLRDIMTLLAPFKVTPVTAAKIYNHFGAGCIDILKKSPFELCRISGFGFRRVDAIVRKTNSNLHDPMRIRGAVFAALEDAGSRGGDLYLPREELLKRVLVLLNDKTVLPPQRVTGPEAGNALDDMVPNGAVVSNRENIYLPKVFDMEDTAARNIASLLMTGPERADISRELEQVKADLGIVLSGRQQEAVRMVFLNSLSIITGSPGTGKTTVLKTILEIFARKYRNKKTMLMAPTGRASRRMAESTGRKDAKTLHSSLGLTQEGENPFQKRTEYLDADLIVIDEFSMVDMWLACQLFTRIRPGTRILLVGDADQLPSVGAGNVFGEMIASGMVPVTVLDEIFRQSRDSFIPYNARLINEGNTRLYFGEEFSMIPGENQIMAADIIQEKYVEEIRKSGIENVQILTPFRSEGNTSAEQLNAVIRETINPFRSQEEEITIGSRRFRVGDRIMQTKNTETASNGDLGFIRGMKEVPDGRLVQLSFGEGRDVEYTPEQMGNIELAYATTIHKAMGSEYETVLIPILKAHAIMLCRNLIYTAVTRARKKVILVGQKGSLCMAIRRNDMGRRNSLLGERIGLYYRSFTHSVAEKGKNFVERLKCAG